MRNIGAMVVAASIAAGAGLPSAAAEAPPVPTAVQQQVVAYAAAWSSHDPARIAALHTPDTVFDLRVDGETPAVGRAAAEARFAGILRDNPGYASTVRKVAFGADFVVIEYAIAMNPPAPFVLGRFRYTPTGAAYSVPAIDMIRFRDGLVAEKVTFLDTESVRAHSSAVVPTTAAK